MATGGESNPELYHFRCSLLKVSQKLRTEEVRELVYICTELKCTENIAKGHDLFLELEKKGLIMPGNYDYLLDRLLQIGREDLVTHLMERICESSHTQTKMLNRLLKSGRDEVALYFMKWMCKSLHTPSTFPAHLMEHLINSGRGDLVMELIGRMSNLHQPRGLQSDQQTMQVVYHAKQSMCASHKTALSMLSSPTSPLSIQMDDVLIKYFQEVRQSAGMYPEPIFTQWPNLSVCEGSGTIKEILSNTLQCVFSYADTIREMVTTITKEETLDADHIEMQSKNCNSVIDDFNKVHAITQWNPCEREEMLNFKSMRKHPGAVLIQTAVKSICSLCEGLLCRRAIEKAEARISDRLFILETVLYTLLCGIPMFHWLRTIIQLAASSNLDLTMYRDTIVKVATEHREPIVQHHNELSQIIGQDGMRNIDSVLKIDKHEMATSNSDVAPTTTFVQNCFYVERYTVVYWYAYLLQLLVLACDCSADPWEMASKMSEHHYSFHEKHYKDILEYAMEGGRKVHVSIYTEVENFKVELIQQCPESSAERTLLSGLLPPLNTSVN